MQQLNFQHSTCGGFTLGSWKVNFYQRQHKPQFAIPVTRNAHDLSAVLDYKMQERPCLPPPKIVTTSPEAIQIRPNTYHGGGLLPWNFAQVWVVTHCIFSPIKWV